MEGIKGKEVLGEENASPGSISGKGNAAVLGSTPTFPLQSLHQEAKLLIC